MKKTLTGKIVSISGDLSVVVEVSVDKINKILNKRYKQSRKMLVHNPGNRAKIGEIVRIVETRPISARKSWIIEIIPEKIAKKSTKETNQ